MKAGVIVENQRLFYETDEFAGEVQIVKAHVDEDGGDVAFDETDEVAFDSEDGFALAHAIRRGWVRVVPHAQLGLMKKATWREWSIED